jgi:Na+/melibiose symporter-like transporter
VALEGEASGARPPSRPAGRQVEGRRLRSLVGLSLGLSGPRAYLAVSGVLLTLLVASRTSSALAITFALCANRLVGWLAYPLVGRASDRTRSPAGRRAPYMAAGLAVMAACTWAYTVVPGYWSLVVLVATAKTASVLFGLTNLAVLPESFGKRRAVKAGAVVALAGGLVSLAIKGTVVASWRSADPASWDPAFEVAALVMAAAAVAVLALVREAPAALEAPGRAQARPALPWRSELGAILSAPNGLVLGLGVAVFWAGVSATGYLAVVYFQKVQHAGAAVQTLAGWVTGAPLVAVGLGGGWMLSRLLTRKQVAVGAPAAGAALSLVQFDSTHIWQTVVLAFAGAPLFFAFVISMGAMLLRLLPAGGGAGELFGKLVAPFSAIGLGLALAAAWAVDASGGDYRVIWLFPAAAGVVQSVVMCFVWVPPGAERPVLTGAARRLGDWARRQVAGRGRGLLGGEITPDDADAASLFELARRLLPDPYLPPAPAGPGHGAPDPCEVPGRPA